MTRLGLPHLVVPATLLVGTGIVMVYSASAPRAELLFGSPAIYLLRQLGGLLLGLVVALALARTPLPWLRRSGLWIWAASALLVAATLTPLGVEINGARRWLALGPVSFQPLEIAKLGVVLGLAHWLADHSDRLQDVRVSLAVPALLAALPAGFLLLQPDFGGAVLLLLFATALVFAAGARLDHLAAGGGIALPIFAVLAAAPEYRLSRLHGFLDPWSDPVGHGYQLVQSLLAFGSGGLWGAGLGAGQQKLGYLPEAHTDFILSVVAEELGLLGVVGVLLCFAVLGAASLAIALRARDRHAALVATGAGLLLWMQGGINAGVATGLLPTTGATLPLLSYGRTSMVVSLAGIGLLISAARHRRGSRA